MAWAAFGLLLWFLFCGLAHGPPATALTAALVRPLVADLRLFAYRPPRPLRRHLGLHRPAARPYFALEATLLDSLRQLSAAGGGAQFVDDPAGADFFWVPHALVAHWIGGPPERQAAALRRYWDGALRPFLSHILHDLPYFNRSGGRDHLFVYLMDNGPVCDYGLGVEDVLHPDPVFHHVLLPMVHIGYHGTQGVPSPFPRHALPLRRRCFAPGHDIVLPQPHSFPPFATDQPFSLAVARGRALASPAAFHFSGSLLSGTGRGCSPGVRRVLDRYCRRTRRTHPFCGPTRHCPQVCSDGENTSMDSAVFALAPGGWACWSTRFFHALTRLAVPVILADGIVEPFELFLDYRRFTVKLAQPQVPANLHRGLGGLLRLAQGFREACGADAPDAERCLTHPVSRWLQAAMEVRDWLSYNASRPRHALLLLLLELRCRRPGGDAPALCRARHNRSAGIAHAEYGVAAQPPLATPWLWWGLPAR